MCKCPTPYWPPSSVSESSLGCIAVIQSLSHIHLFASPCTAAHQAFLSFTISWSLLKSGRITDSMICLSWKALWNLSLTSAEVNNCNREDSFVFHYKCSTNRMLSVSFNYTQWLSAGSPASHIMSIKIKYLCLSPRKHPDQVQLSMTAGRELIHPLQRLMGTRKSLTSLFLLLV